MTHRIGRIQRQVRRAFIASRARPLMIGDLLRHCYPRIAKHKTWHRWNVHRAAGKFAVLLSRDRRGNVWGPR